MTKTLYITGDLSEKELYEQLMRYLKRKKEVKNVGTLDDVIVTGYEEPYKITIKKS